MLEFAKDNGDFRLRVAGPKIGRVSIGYYVTLSKYNFSLINECKIFIFMYTYSNLNFSKLEVKYKSMHFLFSDA